MTDIQQRIQASFNAQGFMTALGARLLSVAEGEVHIELPFSGQFCQQHGYIHAGAITTIVDNACGYAALTKAPPGSEVVTAEFKVNFVRPAIGDRFVAIGKVQSAGKLLTVCTGEVYAYSETGSKLVAMMQATIVSVPSP
ncbi:MAG TPA: PaaI family thioesterase [Telluria sp.]